VKGAWSQYKARPVVGGHFAFMALDGPSLFGNGNGGDEAGWAQVIYKRLIGH